jgi:hypothetical protein
VKHDPLEPIDDARTRQTDEVGSEGGSPGDVEIVQNDDVGAGSDAVETWRPAADDIETVDREKARRSP